MRSYFIGGGPKEGKQEAGPGGPARTRGSAPPHEDPPQESCVASGFQASRGSRGFEALGDFLLRNRAALDDAPIGLGDIDGGGALAGAAAAIEDQIDAAIHHAENVDAAMAGGVAGDIGAGGNQRLVEQSDEPGGRFGARMAERQASGID